MLLPHLELSFSTRIDLMPILPLEPFVFPANLFNSPTPDSEEPLRWWLLHTRPRAEKSLARHLHARQTSFFLPLYHRRWERRGRIFQSHVPLFPGYIFLRGDDDARLTALETNQVAGCLPVIDQDQLQVDLVRVHRLIAAGEPLCPEERLAPGTPVEIIAGALAGLTGKVLRQGRQLRFVVEVQLLQQGVSVEMASWMMEPLANSQHVGV
jgi:transcriptional antiterminator RfaH